MFKNVICIILCDLFCFGVTIIGLVSLLSLHPRRWATPRDRPGNEQKNPPEIERVLLYFYPSYLLDDGPKISQIIEMVVIAYVKGIQYLCHSLCKGYKEYCTINIVVLKI